MATVIDNRNQAGGSMSAANGIIKIIEAATEAKKAQSDLQKELMLAKIKQKMDLQQKEAEFQQNMSHAPQIQAANDKMNNPMGELVNPGAASLGQNGIATNNTAAQSGSVPELPGQTPAQSLINPSQMPQGQPSVLQPSQAPDMPQSQPQQPAMPQQAQIPQGVQIESPTGTPLPPPKGAIQIGQDGKPVFKQLEMADKTYVGIYNKWRSGASLSQGEKQFVQEYLGMKDMAKDPFGTLNIDTVNNSPEQIGAELKAKNPGYYAQLESIKDGKYKITGRGSNEMNRISTQVQTIWPGTDLQALQSRYDTRKDFTSGKTANNITAINTALKHLDSLARNAEVLDNGSFRQGNRLGNILKTQIGDSRVRVLGSDINAVTGELASTFKQTGATDTEIKNFQQSLDAADSKQVIKDVTDEFISLIGGRTQPLLERWQNSFGQDSSFPVVGRSGEAILTKHGFQWNPKTGDIVKNGSSSAGSQSQGGYQEGQTATNPKTGQKLTYRGGKWQ